jgi:putative two-component system response regulator
MMMKNDESIIFAIDDTEENLGVLANILAENKYKVYLFTNGKEAIEALHIITPDLILLDVMMPEMNGYEVCRLLKEEKSSAEIPVIFLTAKTETEDIVKGFQLGGVDYITKPFKKEELLARVKTHIKLNLTERSLKESLNEKELLLNETLKGSIKVLIEILAVTNPEVFNQTIRSKNLTRKIIERLKLKSTWEIEMGVLLSQIGCATIPFEIIKKRFTQQKLSGDEAIMFFSHPVAGSKFISNIPRLEKIASSIRNQFSDFDAKSENTDLTTDFIRILFDYDILIQSGKSQQQAIEIMDSRGDTYNTLLLRALEAEVRELMQGFLVKPIKLIDLKVGMVLADDIRSEQNISLVMKNSEISEVMLEKVLNFSRFETICEPLKILDPII